MTGRQEYDDRTKDRQRILGKYMIDKRALNNDKMNRLPRQSPKRYSNTQVKILAVA
jgi:hypothetical protein